MVSTSNSLGICSALSYVIYLGNQPKVQDHRHGVSGLCNVAVCVLAFVGTSLYCLVTVQYIHKHNYHTPLVSIV